MKIVVIGSGIIGVTTAYSLIRRGHEVTVIDRQEGPGRETSFANGALLTPSMAEPWNAPGCWRVLLASLFRRDAALQLRASAVPGLLGWGSTFLSNSREMTFRYNALCNLRLALYSLEIMQSLRLQTEIEYGRSSRGTLRVFRDAYGIDQASAAAVRLQPHGLSFRRLSVQQLVDFEPGLIPIAEQLRGGLHYEADETGDAFRFCVALAEHAREQGVEFRFRTEVSSLEIRSGRVTAAVSGDERFIGDRYIVAAGSHSAPLLRRAGVHLPVRPAKGYSVTLDDHENRPSLRIPVVDDHRHAAIVPLEGLIRVVGTAEFAGFDRSLNRNRILNLMALLHDILPQGQYDPATAKPWCGLRPMSADGVPIIGPTSVSNLLVNTGHGHLGWTLAAGSAQLLANSMSGQSPSIDPAPFSLARFMRSCASSPA